MWSDGAGQGRLSAADVRAAQFRKPPFGRRGYDPGSVDDFLARLAAALDPNDPARMSAAEVRDAAFRKPPLGTRGYAEDEVDDLLDRAEAALADNG